MVFILHRPCHSSGSSPQGLTSSPLSNYRIFPNGETIGQAAGLFLVVEPGQKRHGVIVVDIDRRMVVALLEIHKAGIPSFVLGAGLLLLGLVAGRLDEPPELAH